MMTTKSFSNVIRKAAIGACVPLALSLMASTALSQERVLNVGNPFAPISLDPSRSGNGRAGTFLMPAYEPLVRTLADGSFEAALATSWEVSDDTRSVTFKLREGVKFSDGEALTAEAAKRSIEYWVGNKGPFSGNLASLDTIEVIDDLTFKVNLKSPNPDIVSLFNTYWLSGDLISPKALDNPEVLQTGTYGAGAYVLDPAATVSGRSYTYVANKNYYDPDRVHWDRIVISVFEDQNSALQAMQAGQLQLLVSDPLTANSASKNLPDNIRVVSDPVQWAGLVIYDRNGEKNKALGDVRVRKALNHGVDRALVTQALFGDFGTPTAQIQTRGFLGYDEANENVYPYDVEKAKSLLAEAGYGNGLTIRTASVNNTLNSMLSQVIAGQLSEIGVTLEIVELQNLGQLRETDAKRENEAVIFNTNAGVPNLAKFQPLGENGSLNPFKNTDPELTRLLDVAGSTKIEDAADAWKSVYSWVVDQAWFVPVSAVDVAYFASNTVETPKPGQSIVIDLIDVKPAQ